MPYIYCESCGSGCYSNVVSCPRCRLPVRRIHARIEPSDAMSLVRAAQANEDTEIEVREALYGWHTGCVARVAVGG